MIARRHLLPLALAGLATLGLTACEKPAPIVTVQSGTHSEWKEADVFCFEGQSLADNECVQRADELATLPVAPGQRVAVDVSEEVAERGWYLELSGPGGQGQAQQSDVIDDSFFAFTAPQLGPEGTFLVVRTLGEDGPQGPPSGEWVFELVPE